VKEQMTENNATFTFIENGGEVMRERKGATRYL
jgi:hypothetical protein